MTKSNFRPRGTLVTTKNILEISIYYAARHCIPHTWLNHDDQFLYPNENWKNGKEFQLDCLIFTLFHEKNCISTNGDAVGCLNPRSNHWIPFTEAQVGSKKAFKSTFMSDFIKDFLAGKIDVASTMLSDQSELFYKKTTSQSPRNFHFQKKHKQSMIQVLSFGNTIIHNQRQIQMPHFTTSESFFRAKVKAAWTTQAMMSGTMSLLETYGKKWSFWQRK